MGIYLSLIMALMAFCFLFVGIKVILSKKPLFISARYLFVFVLLGFSPQFVTAATMLFSDSPIRSGLLLYLSPIMFVILLVFLWFQLQGYMAYGVSDDTFRDALHFSLDKNNLPFEEKLSAIELPSINATLQVAIQSWIGAGQLKLKKSKDAKILPEIINGINQYYSENEVKPNNFTSIFYIVMGVFLLIFGVTFFSIFP